MNSDENENKKYTEALIGAGIVIGTSAMLGVLCYTLGFSKGRKEMTDSEKIMRHLMAAARKDGEAPMHWICTDGSEELYLIKFVKNSLESAK